MPEYLLEDPGFTELARFVITDSTLDDTLLRVAELACKVIPADMAGITLLAEGRPATRVFTDPQAAVLDTDKYGTDGPAGSRSAASSSTGSIPPIRSSAGRCSSPPLSRTVSPPACRSR